jgi:hypothetical protein
MRMARNGIGELTGDLREAVQLPVVVHVDHVVPRELPEEGGELAHPTRLHPADQELHPPLELVRADEQRHQHVRVVVVHVSGEPAVGEEEAGDGVVPGARGRRRRPRLRERLQRVLADVGHGHGVVVAPLLTRRGRGTAAWRR